MVTLNLSEEEAKRLSEALWGMEEDARHDLGDEELADLYENIAQKLQRAID